MKEDSFTIDSVNEAYARVIRSDGSSRYIETKFLPEGIREGDVINVTMTIDREETERLSEEVESLESKLFQ